MYQKEKTLQLPESCSAVNNALTVRSADNSESTWFVYPHGSSLVVTRLVTGAVETRLVPRQPHQLISQVCWAHIGPVWYLVACSDSLIEFYDSNISAVLHTHTPVSDTIGESTVYRGVASFSNKICVGCSDGSILVFATCRGQEAALRLHQTVRAHVQAVTALASDTGDKEGGAWMTSADGGGCIVVWHAEGHDLAQTYRIDSFKWPCTALSLCRGVLVAGYGGGMLRMFDAVDGRLYADAVAHQGWISSIDTAPDAEDSHVLVVTVGEDGHVKAWRLSADFLSEHPLVHKFTAVEKDCRLMGVAYMRVGGASFAVSAYDRKFLAIYSM